MPSIERPLHKCLVCKGKRGKQVEKLERTTVYTYDINTGKKVPVVTHKTVRVWENCRNCNGTGVK